MRHPSFFPLLFASLTFAACGGEADVPAESDLTAGAYLTVNSPYMWAPTSYEEFRQNAMGFDGAPLPAALDEKDPLTVRLQTWMDRMDGIVRDQVQRATGQPLFAPKPIARVLQSKSLLNAWVSGIPSCLGAPLTGSETVGPIGALYDGYVFPMTSCVRPGWNSSQVATFLNTSMLRCSLEPDGQGFYATGDNCQARHQGSPDLAIFATGQYVQFSTDYLAEMSEVGVVITIAHELGHYYMGHGTEVGSSKFGYWYERSENLPATPTKAPNTEELEAAYKEVINQEAPHSGPQFVSRYNPRMRNFLLHGLKPLLLERTEKDFVCQAARDALGQWTQEFANPVPSKDAQQSFIAYEHEIEQCATDLKLENAGSQALSATAVLLAVQQHRVGTEQASIKPGGTLADLLTQLEHKAKELDAKAEALVAKLRENKVGLYTTEQAADEFSLQLTTKLGISPEETFEGWLAFMRVMDAAYARSYTPEQIAAYQKSTHQVDTETCEAMFRNGFAEVDKSGQGSPTVVPMGQLDEPHHSNCYRLYNFYREAQAHRFVTGPAQPPLSPAWSELKAHAAEVSAAATQ